MADWCEVCGPEACSVCVQLPGSTPSHQPLLIGLLTCKLLCHQPTPSLGDLNMVYCK